VGIELFGPVAAWYVNDILAGAPPPPGMTPAEARHGRLLSFKTGTSYGYRDAWAVGYDRDVTIAVWVGRPDGTPTPGRSGRLTAAPVMFKIADLLPATGLSAVPVPPPEGTLISARRDLPPGLRYPHRESALDSRLRLSLAVTQLYCSPVTKGPLRMTTRPTGVRRPAGRRSPAVC